GRAVRARLAELWVQVLEPPGGHLGDSRVSTEQKHAHAGLGCGFREAEDEVAARDSPGYRGAGQARGPDDRRSIRDSVAGREDQRSAFGIRVEQAQDVEIRRDDPTAPA